MSQCLLRSDTVIYEAATQCPVDELVLTFHLVYRHSSVCQFPARLYLGHLRTPHHWSQRSLTERRSCKHIVNLSGVNGSQTDGRHMGPTNRSCKHSFRYMLQPQPLLFQLISQKHVPSITAYLWTHLHIHNGRDLEIIIIIITLFRH